MTNLTMARGDTLSFGVKITGLNGEDLSAAFFTVKEERGGEILLQKTLGNGITKSTDEDDVYIVRCSPAETAALEATSYHYDMEIQIGEDTTVYNALDTFTILEGQLRVKEK